MTRCGIHSQRQLSIAGHATVLSSLPLSKLWHVLCITSYTNKQMSKIKSIATTFLNRNIPPPISWHTPCPTEKERRIELYRSHVATTSTANSVSGSSSCFCSRFHYILSAKPAYNSQRPARAATGTAISTDASSRCTA